MEKPRLILRDWIKIEKLSLNALFSNENAIDLIENILIKYPYYINWNILSINPNAIEILKKNRNNIESLEGIEMK